MLLFQYKKLEKVLGWSFEKLEKVLEWSFEKLEKVGSVNLQGHKRLLVGKGVDGWNAKCLIHF